jgi:hypothetical protein
MIKHRFFLFVYAIGLTSCSSPSSSPPLPLKGEYIQRHQDELSVQVEPMVAVKREDYPWEKEKNGLYPRITKEFFRCKGSQLNTPCLIQKEKETVRYYDCGGTQKHSLPLREQKEFIYPILIDLLNYLQVKSGKRVVITCGHCCLDHNLYLDSSPSNQTSKHLLGAEVDFYIQGMEQQPEQVMQWILGYYQEQAKYKGLKDFEEFTRYEKGDLNLATLPWMNKEIFIKIYKKDEKRDFDNRHPYPYLSIQVRYDWDLQEKVSYSWDKAFHNLHRW